MKINKFDKAACLLWVDLTKTGRLHQNWLNTLAEFLKTDLDSEGTIACTLVEHACKCAMKHPHIHKLHPMRYKGMFALHRDDGTTHRERKIDSDRESRHLTDTETDTDRQTTRQTNICKR